MRPRFWLFVLLILVALGFLRLRLDMDVLNLLPSELPAVEGLKTYQRNFTSARELILTLEGQTAEQTEAGARSLAEKLRAATNLVAEVAWQPPWLERPEETSELVAAMWLNQPPGRLRDLSARLEPGPLRESLNQMREQLSTGLSPSELGTLGYDPFGLLAVAQEQAAGFSSPGQGEELFASPDGKFRLIFVEAAGEIRSYRECIDWVNSVNELANQWRASDTNFSGIETRFTGGAAFEAEISQGMERDMRESIGVTSIIIALLFWIAHRRITPMLWLLTLLALILAATLALGGLIFGSINVVSLGFASILLGLAVDYGVVHYQEALAAPTATIPQIRRAIGPSIFWAAVTTIAAFLVLNFGGMPGLAQLGSMVGLGVALSALMMLYAFLPPLFRNREKPQGQATGEAQHIPAKPPIWTGRGAWIGTAIFGVMILGALARGLPRIDESADPLRPRQSEAFDALTKVQKQLTRGRDPYWVVTAAPSIQEVRERLERAAPILQKAASNGFVANFQLPTALWPDAQNQASNRTIVAEIAGKRAALHEAALAAGFTKDATVLGDRILDSWQGFADGGGVYWPSNRTSRWIMKKFAANKNGDWVCVGFVEPASSGAPGEWANELHRAGFAVSSWELLGAAAFQRVMDRLPIVVIPMALLVLLSLWLAFGRATEILLSIAVLAVSGLALLAVMKVAGWSWNLLNVMGLPLILGSGVDYSLFIQLGLRRHNGDLGAVHNSVGKALLLCGATAIAGFGTLAWSTNAGIASLGAICAVGIGFNMLISIFLLPTWWRAAVRRSPSPREVKSPSALYGALGWRAALALARMVPPNALRRLALACSRVYWLFARARREVVVQNLAPIVGARAEEAASRLADHFSRKLVDLWLYESRGPDSVEAGEVQGLENFEAAQAGGRGVLILTPHLGNWELGAALLGRHNVKLLVITQPEPGRGFTEMRQAARERWGIETLVIREDPFAFMEVITRLEAGAKVALLLDRPPARTAVEVELFGKPFDASIAAAELARVSGCSLLPVILPWTPQGYSARILPPIAYDRRALGNREARRALTAQILRAFEPFIREYADQWYHFVPIWPRR